MSKKIEHLIARIISLHGNTSYDVIVKLPFSHDFYNQLVESIIDPKIKKKIEMGTFDD